jgi:hypothetical protein
MSFSNINGNNHIDALINHNVNAFSNTPYPPQTTNPFANPPQSGHDLNAKVSSDPNMGPRNNNFSMQMNGGPAGGPTGPGKDAADLSKVSAEVREDGVKTASHDGDDAIKDMANMNAMNMKFQVASGLMAMQKGMVEALAKTVKDAGSKVAQLAG